MAFGGTPAIASAGRNVDVITGWTLNARVGAPAIAAADTGQLTTAAAGMNQTGLTANLGPGRGNWVAADVNRVRVTVTDGNTAAQGMAGETSLLAYTVAITAADLVVTLHNRGAQNMTTAGRCVVEFIHSIVA